MRTIPAMTTLKRHAGCATISEKRDSSSLAGRIKGSCSCTKSPRNGTSAISTCSIWWRISVPSPSTKPTRTTSADVRWALRNADAAVVERLARETGLSPTIARLLVARGVESAEGASRFLSPSIDHLHSPYLMTGLRQAVQRLQAAVGQNETVLIYGDY